MKFLLSALLALVLCLGTAKAIDQELTKQQNEAYGMNEVLDKAPSEIKRETSLDEGLAGLGKRLTGEFGEVFRRGVKCIALVLAISVLCAVVGSLYNATDSREPMYLPIVGALAVMGAAAGSINSVIGMGRASIEQLNAFSKVLLPSLMTASAATGVPLAATAQYSATILFSDLLMTVITNVLFPLVYAYLAAATANAAIGNDSMGRIADFFRWIASSCLKIFLMVFVGYLTMSGLIASRTDLVGTKTAKFAISGVVPVVGSILADATETVVAGAMVVKNSIGVVGMLTILSICLTPFLVLAVNYFLFKAAAALSAPMCEPRLGKLVDQIGGGFGLVLGMTGAAALLLFISIVSSLFVVGAV